MIRQYVKKILKQLFCYELSEIRSDINFIKKHLTYVAEVSNKNAALIKSEIKNIDLEFSAYTIFIVDYKKGENLFIEFPEYRQLSRDVFKKYYGKRENNET